MKCSPKNIFCKGAENKINFLGLIFPRMPTDIYYFWEGKKNFAQKMTDLDEETSKATHILPYLVPCNFARENKSRQTCQRTPMPCLKSSACLY